MGKESGLPRHGGRLANQLISADVAALLAEAFREAQVVAHA